MFDTEACIVKVVFPEVVMTVLDGTAAYVVVAVKVDDPDHSMVLLEDDG
jgi:hypothetical protein